MMLGTFPDPWPDELLYSVFARYGDRVAYRQAGAVLSDLFGSTLVVATTPFASHLAHLACCLPHNCSYSAEQLLMEHTLLGFYAPFLPADRQACLKADLLETRGPLSHGRAGIRASTVPSPARLQYCPDCSRDDIVRYGEPYWHRIHQVPGVLVCHRHHCWLKRSQVPARGAESRHEFVSAQRALTEVPASCALSASPAHESLIEIAQEVAWVLGKRPETIPGLETLHESYRTALAQANLVTAQGSVRQDHLQALIVQRLGPALLRLLRCSFSSDQTDTWVMRLLRRPTRAHHPLHHLLLQRALGLTMKSAAKGQASVMSLAPFGDGPWPCLNAASRHHGQAVIETCLMTSVASWRKKPAATFPCSCGMVYTCAKPLDLRSRVDRQVRIQAYGQLWESTLERLWTDPDRSVNEIAHLLHVDPLTVKRHAVRLGLPLVRIGRIGTRRLSLKHPLRASPTYRVLPQERSRRRKRWVDLLHRYAGETRTQLRRRDPGTYAWLYRHDRTWLTGHLPVATSRATRNPRPSARVDWQHRDRTLAQHIERVVPLLRHPDTDGHLRRLSSARVGRQTGHLAMIQQHLDKLPRTASALARHVETREQFAIRRIAWAVATLREAGQHPSRWEFIRLAGVARLVRSEGVSQALDAALQCFANQ